MITQNNTDVLVVERSVALSKPKLLHVGNCIENLSTFIDKVFDLLEGNVKQYAKSSCCGGEVTYSRSEDYTYIMLKSGEVDYSSREYSDGFWNDEYYCYECGDECKIK